MTARLGVDIGGTFTDVVLLDPEAGTMSAVKVATDYDDPTGALLEGIARLQGSAPPADQLNHATTLATNAILEGKLPKGALITTAGFRDVLDIGRIQRPVEGIYDFNVDNPEPLVPRARRLEVAERIDATGAVVEPLDEQAVRERARELAAANVGAVAVALLFAFANDSHERRIGEILAEELPGVALSLSSVVSPEIREFERFSTTVIDALLKPILAPYVIALADRASRAGIGAVRIMLASGGLAPPALAGKRPVRMVNSGPSAGVLAAANLGRTMGVDDMIAIDMGGTSLDIGLVEGGRAVHRYEGKIAGYPIRMPMIDVAAVAAGGGSIAYVDQLGYVQVSRESAGSEPGPAAYGRGGTRPTITDADVILGRLGDGLAGTGGLVLDRAAADRAMAAEIADPLGISVEEAARAVLNIIQARMVKAITANTLEKGLDVRHLPLLAYGGAGPTHAVELARQMAIDRVIIPALAGSFSAIGLTLCPLRWDVSAMVLKVVDDLGDDDLADALGALDAEARATLGPVDERLLARWLAMMRYAGQSYELAVDLGEPWRGEGAGGTLKKLIAAFHDLHERHYAYRSEAETVELVQLRLSVSGAETVFPYPPDPAAKIRKTGRRTLYFTTTGAEATAAVVDRDGLARRAVVDGPAVIDGQGSSALIPPGWRATVDDWLNLDVRRLDEA